MIEKINKLIIETTKEKESRLLGTYRLVKSEFQKAEKSGKSWDPIDIILGMITTRKDSMSQYLKAGRQDLADQESFEIQTLQNLLPPLPSEEEMREAVKKEISKIGASVGMKDTKGILEKLKPGFPGISGKLVSEEIRAYVSRT